MARGYVKKGGEGRMGGKRRMGEGRKKAKESRVVHHPKLNPGCATVSNMSAGQTDRQTDTTELFQ